MSAQIEKLKQQEQELEAAQANTRVEPVLEVDPERSADQTQVPPQEPTEITTAPPETVPVETPEDPREAEQQKQKRTNWKKRFTNYKSSVDPKLAELRTQNAALQASTAAMEQRMLDMQAQLESIVPTEDPFAGTLSEEQANTFGPDGLEIVKQVAVTAAEAKVAPVKQDLLAERKRRIELEQQTAEATMKRNYDMFLGKLERSVPDYKLVDADPRFGKFLDTQDPGSMYSRRHLFHAAERELNSAEVSRHMNDFKKAIGTVPNNPAIDKHVAPVGAPGAQVAPNASHAEKTMSMAWITQFTNDVNRGKYKENMDEARRIQADIDNHLNTGGKLVP